MSNTIDDLDVRAKAAEIIRWSLLQQLEEAGLRVISHAEWQEQQATLVTMRRALKLALQGAKHESCKFSEDDPYPTWHCCDWNDVVTAIEKALQKDAGKVLERRLEALERLYEVVRNRRAAEKACDKAGEDGDAEGQVVALPYIDYFDDAIAEVIEELEATERA